ncbi:MAG: hypothetical protein AUJ12_02295 [Alphaproteobacteria bacterium CG1_02_46_17]|nr:MAG: hypothetical protein AUJ12_02295 [Alphaproteobacteria bacterium CG1_02_46_17]
MRYDEIVRLVRAYNDDLLTSWKEEIAEKGPVSVRDTDTWIKQGEAMLKSSRTIWDNIDGNGKSLVGNMLNDLGIKIDKDHPDYKTIREEYAHGAIKFAEQIRAYSDNFRNIPEMVMDANAANSIPLISAKPKHTLKKVIAEFMRDKEMESAWGNRAKDERKACFDLLLEIFGEDYAIAQINHEQARQVKDILLKLPKNRAKKRETRGLTLLRQIEVDGVEKISVDTFNKYTMIYSALMKWAQRHGYAEKNPFEGIMLRTTNVQKRHDFTDQDIVTIVTALKKQRSEEGLQNYRYWGVLLAMYTGARLNEVASLTCDDVRCEDGVWYFDINDEGEKKSLKTEAAKRKVPVHPDLIEYGFLDFYEEARGMSKQGDRLLDGLTFNKTSKWGRNLGRWFNDKFLEGIPYIHHNLKEGIFQMVDFPFQRFEDWLAVYRQAAFDANPAIAPSITKDGKSISIIDFLDAEPCMMA